MIISRVHEGEADPTSSASAPFSLTRPSTRTTISRFPTSAPALDSTTETTPRVCVIRVPAERASYAPFRTTIFQDPVVNPLLRGVGGDPDRLATARESKRLWTANGPLINSRTVKTATCPGSAFKNQALSADRLYSTNRNSLGYDVHRSLRGTSLCSTTKRFDLKLRTSESVGPGSYNLHVTPCRPIHQAPHTEPPKSTVAVLPSNRLLQWGGTLDSRPMDCADEWKTTSEKPSPTVYSFPRARQASWIEQIEERQRRSDPEARRAPSLKEIARQSRPEHRLPDFVQGNRNPVYTKTGAIAVLNQPKSPRQHEQVATDCPAALASGSITSLSPSSFDSLDQQALESIQAFVP